MEKSRTRKIFFVMCIIFMGIFAVLFSVAQQTITNSAYFEAYAEAEIKEMQLLYDVYSDLRNYYDESIAFFASGEHFNDSIADTFETLEHAVDEDEDVIVNELTGMFGDHIKGMDLIFVDANSIICMYTENGELFADVKSHDEGRDINFADKNKVLGFLSDYGFYAEKEKYASNHVIIEELRYWEDIYIIGIPDYHEIFDFVENEMVIYNKDGLEELRLNTESFKENTLSVNLGSNKSHKKHGFGKNRYILCYYSNEDERGDYSLGVIRNLDLSYRYIIYAALLIFFTLISIAFWRWSEKITKPLEFFTMWIKLIKDKGKLGEDDKADMPMPQENYFLQNNIMLFFTSCLIPILFIGLIQWYAENQIINGYVEERYMQSAEYYGQILDEQYDLWRDPVTLLCNDQRLVNSLEEYNENPDGDSEKIFIQYVHEYFQIIFDEIKELTIYTSAGKAVVSSANDEVNDRYIRYRVHSDEDYNWSFAEGLDTFVLHQKIYNESGEIIGYCRLDLHGPDLKKGTAYNRDYLFLGYLYEYTDKVFCLLGSPDITDQNVISMITSTEEYPLAKSIKLEKANVNYFYIVKDKIFFNRIWDKYVVAFMNVVFFLSIALVFSAGILTRTTLNPIIHISNALYTDSPQVPVSTLLMGSEEFALIVNRVKTLSEQVNAYAREQKLLEAERQEHEKKRKDAEMLTLQTQINPHFMYNIFSSIAVLIKGGETEKATKMVTYTGNLMRLGLYRGHVMISLKEEIEHVIQYIKIQQIRYNDCMEVRINIDDSLMQLKVVKFILQPVIENAIEHNVGYLEDRKLEIDINAFKKDGELVLQIVDNGRGLSGEKVKKLQRGIDNFDMSNHLGLANINERIKLNCGQDYGVILDNNKGHGLKVELVLPIVVEKEE